MEGYAASLGSERLCTHHANGGSARAFLAHFILLPSPMTLG